MAYHGLATKGWGTGDPISLATGGMWSSTTLVVARARPVQGGRSGGVAAHAASPLAQVWVGLSRGPGDLMGAHEAFNAAVPEREPKVDPDVTRQRRWGRPKSPTRRKVTELPRALRPDTAVVDDDVILGEPLDAEDVEVVAKAPDHSLWYALGAGAVGGIVATLAGRYLMSRGKNTPARPHTGLRLVACAPDGEGAVRVGQRRVVVAAGATTSCFVTPAGARLVLAADAKASHVAFKAFNKAGQPTCSVVLHGRDEVRSFLGLDHATIAARLQRQCT